MNPKWRNALLRCVALSSVLAAPIATAIAHEDASHTHAPDSTPSANAPAQVLPKALQPLASAGFVPAYYGREGGLDVWWIEAKDGPRPLYTTPDGRYLITGVMYDSVGATGGELTSATGRQLEAIRQASVVPSAPAPAPMGALSAPAPLSGVRAAPSPTAPTGLVGAPSPASPSALAVAPAPVPPPTPAPLEPSAKPSRGEGLLATMEQAKWSELGAAQAPLVYLVVDPTCHFSQQVWNELQAPIAAGRVRVRLLITNALGDDATPIAAALLALPNAAQGWSGYIASGNVPAANAMAGAAALAVNETVRRNSQAPLSLNGVPWFIYRAANGRVRHMYGAPQPSIEVVLSDLAPSSSAR